MNHPNGERSIKSQIPFLPEFTIVLTSLFVLVISTGLISSASADRLENDRSEISEPEIQSLVPDYENGNDFVQNKNKSLSDRVDEAIEDGVKYLKKKQKKDGSWNYQYGRRYPAGETALTLLALLKSGVDKKDPVIKKGMKYLRKQEFKKTYSVAISIMAVEALFTPDKEQKKAGAFAEGKKEKYKPEKRKLTKNAKEWMFKAVKWLLLNMKKDGTWGYGRKDPPGSIIQTPITTDSGGGVILKRKGAKDGRGKMDHSNTQYAMLGFNSAARCGFYIHRKHWGTILKHWLEAQKKDGPKVDLKLEGVVTKEKESGTIKAKARSWAYRMKQSKRQKSMTPVGIASVQIARHNIQKLGGMPDKIDKRALQSIYDGLAWIQKNYDEYSMNEKPEGGNGWDDYYDMYSVERAMMLPLIQKIGGHNWYREGATQLVKAQQKSGAWGGGRGPIRRRGGGDKDPDIVETCFALLFLKRATLPTAGIDTGTGS